MLVLNKKGVEFQKKEREDRGQLVEQERARFHDTKNKSKGTEEIFKNEVMVFSVDEIGMAGEGSRAMEVGVVGQEVRIRMITIEI